MGMGVQTRGYVLTDNVLCVSLDLYNYQKSCRWLVAKIIVRSTEVPVRYSVSSDLENSAIITHFFKLVYRVVALIYA